MQLRVVVRPCGLFVCRRLVLVAWHETLWGLFAVLVFGFLCPGRMRVDAWCADLGRQGRAEMDVSCSCGNWRAQGLEMKEVVLSVRCHKGR